MWKTLMQTSDSAAALVMRLALGIVIFPHGAQKLLGWFGGRGFFGTIEGFSQMGLPAVLTFLVIIGEFFGGLGLIVGFLTRVAAAGVGLIMLGAMFLVHWQHGFFMNWIGQKAGEGFEFHILAVGLAIGLIILGGGKGSVDRAVAQ
jgi:putative oxidoreductase